MDASPFVEAGKPAKLIARIDVWTRGRAVVNKDASRVTLDCVHAL